MNKYFILTLSINEKCLLASDDTNLRNIPTINVPTFTPMLSFTMKMLNPPFVNANNINSNYDISHWKLHMDKVKNVVCNVDI